MHIVNYDYTLSCELIICMHNPSYLFHFNYVCTYIYINAELILNFKKITFYSIFFVADKCLVGRRRRKAR